MPSEFWPTCILCPYSDRDCEFSFPNVSWGFLRHGEALLQSPPSGASERPFYKQLLSGSFSSFQNSTIHKCGAVVFMKNHNLNLERYQYNLETVSTVTETESELHESSRTVSTVDIIQLFAGWNWLWKPWHEILEVSLPVHLVFWKHETSSQLPLRISFQHTPPRQFLYHFGWNDEVSGSKTRVQVIPEHIYRKWLVDILHSSFSWSRMLLSNFQSEFFLKHLHSFCPGSNWEEVPKIDAAFAYYLDKRVPSVLTLFSDLFPNPTWCFPHRIWLVFDSKFSYLHTHLTPVVCFVKMFVELPKALGT